jgi:hypothetical protein
MPWRQSLPSLELKQLYEGVGHHALVWQAQGAGEHLADAKQPRRHVAVANPFDESSLANEQS